ncbi:MAG: FliM/FliN family flagellar motor switch protein [Polyangiaceae bacterium]
MTLAGYGEGAGAERGEAQVRVLDLSGRERQLRAAMTAMDRIGAAFVRYARRSMPFLARHRARIVATPVQIASMVADAANPLPTGPSYAVRLGTKEGNAWATITLNSDAIALTLEGALGGGSGATPVQLTAPELTPAQRALISRVGNSLALDLATAVREEARLTMTILPPDSAPPQAPASDSLEVVCQVEGMQVPASMVISASAEALEASAREQSNSGDGVPGDPRFLEAMQEVPVEVVAELGRISLGLKKVLSFRVGDVIRLYTATDDPVSVRVGGVEKFLGAPILSRGQLAIEIRSRHER